MRANDDRVTSHNEICRPSFAAFNAIRAFTHVLRKFLVVATFASFLSTWVSRRLETRIIRDGPDGAGARRERSFIDGASKFDNYSPHVICMRYPYP